MFRKYFERFTFKKSDKNNTNPKTKLTLIYNYCSIETKQHQKILRKQLWNRNSIVTDITGALLFVITNDKVRLHL